MHGNVWEWCEDVRYPNYTGAPSDGSAWRTGAEQSQRVVRGASWNNGAWSCRSADRDGLTAGNRGSSEGFRVVLVSP